MPRTRLTVFIDSFSTTLESSGFGRRRETPKDRGNARGTEGTEAAAGTESRLWSGRGPSRQFSHFWAPLAGLCHPGTHYCHFPVHRVPLKFLSPSLRSLPLCPWPLSLPGWAWGPTGGRRGGSEMSGTRVEGWAGGGQSGGGCQGCWRELSTDFREASRCRHGNHRPVTSLKKKKDKFGNFICYLCTLCQDEKWRSWARL